MGRYRSHSALLVITVAMALLVMCVNVVLIVQFVQDPENSIPTGGVVAVCIYGVFYFAVCLRMVRDELRAIAAFTMGFCMGLTGRGRIQNEVLTEALTEEVSTSTKP